jgi:8-oxo-dGTP pyrophosphatase MutT (NUDIX family)
MELDIIRKNLSAGLHESTTPDDLTPAAVLLPLFEKDGALHILFTKRTQTVRAHKGQISFPGGVRDKADENLLATALRESSEEVGLQPKDVDIIGPLKPVGTVTSGFLVHTFVGLIPYPYPFKLNSREVAEILTVPLSYLASPKNWRERFSNMNDGPFEGSFVSYGEHIIWGATARILRIFFRTNGIDVGQR